MNFNIHALEEKLNNISNNSKNVHINIQKMIQSKKNKKNVFYQL